MKLIDILMIGSAIPAYFISYYLIKYLSPVHNGVRYISGKFVALLGLVLWFFIGLGVVSLLGI